MTHDEAERAFDLGDMTSPSGGIERDFPIEWYVPDDIQGTWIARHDSTIIQPALRTESLIGLPNRKPGPTMLSDFLALASPETMPEQILAYAQVWGLLGMEAGDLDDRDVLRRLDLPTLLAQEAMDAGAVVATLRIRLAEMAERIQRTAISPPRSARTESIASWRVTAKVVSSILIAASSVHQSQPISTDVLRRLTIPWDSGHSDLRGSKRLRVHRAIVRYNLNAFVYYSNVRPVLTWFDTPYPAITFGSGPNQATLAQALAMELLAAVARRGNLYTCDGCGQPYSREGRRPKAGQKNYCRTCRDAGVRYTATQRGMRPQPRKTLTRKE